MLFNAIKCYVMLSAREMELCVLLFSLTDSTRVCSGWDTVDETGG